MTAWEYKAERLAGMQIDNQLNFLGREGWELIEVLHQPEEDHPFLCILKRPLKQSD